MKKLLFVIALSTLLMGCSNNQQQVKNQGTETNNEQMPNNNDNGNQNQTDDSNDNNPVITKDTATKTVTFYNGGFTSSTLDQSESQQKFINWFNGEDEGFLESIRYTGFAQLQNFNEFTTLSLGSQKSTGEIQFNFSVDIVKVELEIQGYYKYISYNNTYSVDTASKFYLDTDEYDLSVNSDYQGEGTKENVSKEYSESVNSLTISNDRGRVFVHSMTITYVK